MSSLIACETLLCCVCDQIIEVGDRLIYCDDQPIHEGCEAAYYEEERDG